MEPSYDGEEAPCPHSIKLLEEHGHFSLEPRMEEVIRNDDRKEFVSLVSNLKCDQLVANHILRLMFCCDSAKCAEAVLAGEAGGSFDFSSFCSEIESTPLHEAAATFACNLTKLFLDHAGQADIRVFSGKTDLIGMLPLNMVLANIRSDCSLRDWTQKSAFMLLVKLCAPRMRATLETVRLLAQHTKDIEKETSVYLKEGKMVELCALMLAGCRPSTNFLLPCEDEEPEKRGIKQLLEIFQRIGDKLEIYIDINRPQSLKISQVVAELASLFEDAGLPVKSIETPVNLTIINNERQDAYGQMRRFHWTVQHGLSHRESFSRALGMSQGSILGSHSYHTSSTLKVHKNLPCSTQVRGSNYGMPQSYKKSHHAFFVIARRAIRRI